MSADRLHSQSETERKSLSPEGKQVSASARFEGMIFKGMI